MSTAPTLQIDLNALVSNWKTLASHSGNAETSAVIKADAYGLGIEPVATALSKAGCRTFFVAMVHEGERVRACDKGPISIFSMGCSRTPLTKFSNMD